MGLLSKHRTIPADFRGVTLVDVLNRLKAENYFGEDESFHLVEVVNKNHIVFGVPPYKLSPRELHEIEYLENEKRLSIKSRYTAYFFSTLFIYALPLVILIFGGTKTLTELLKILGIIYLCISIFIVVIGSTSLSQSAKGIERELTIRLNYLLREKGFKIKL